MGSGDPEANASIEYYKKMIHATSNAEVEEEIEKEIEKIQSRASKTNGDELYNFSNAQNEDPNGVFLTVVQCTNYISRCMVQGVDKSKIVPIYDWDGKLLWPTEADVIKKPKQEEAT